MIPTSTVRSKLILRGALWAYERLGGVERADYHEVWSKAELAEKEPLIERSRLNGAVVYPEFLTDDSRLTVATVRSAIDHGATVATYLRATNIRKEQTFSIDAASTLPGEMSELTISARAVVNAAGPWVDQVCDFGAAPATQAGAQSGCSFGVQPRGPTRPSYGSDAYPRRTPHIRRTTGAVHLYRHYRRLPPGTRVLASGDGSGRQVFVGDHAEGNARGDAVPRSHCLGGRVSVRWSVMVPGVPQKNSRARTRCGPRPAACSLSVAVSYQRIAPWRSVLSIP